MGSSCARLCTSLVRNRQCSLLPLLLPDRALTCLFFPHKSWQAATAGCPSLAVTKHPANSAAAPAASAAPCPATLPSSSLAALCRRAAAQPAGRVRKQCSFESIYYICARPNSSACSRMSLDLESTHTADVILPHVEASCCKPRQAYADTDLPGHFKATLQAVAMQQHEVNVFCLCDHHSLVSLAVHMRMLFSCAQQG